MQMYFDNIASGTKLNLNTGEASADFAYPDCKTHK